MERVNVTVSFDADLVKEVRHLAIDEGLSLSGYPNKILEERVGKKKGYEEAKKRALAMMEEGLGYRVPDKIPWTWNELYER